jgi:hypothetical protein
MLRIPDEACAKVLLPRESDSLWLQSAPPVELTHSHHARTPFESGLHGERFSPRSDGEGEPRGILTEWFRRIERD